jgi:hypothetical protein
MRQPAKYRIGASLDARDTAAFVAGDRATYY